MDWVKLATRYYDDEVIESMDDAAEVMFVRGIARAGELEREGFIPDSSLPKLTRRRRYEALVEQLVANGLWTRVPGGVRVTNWSGWQDALDDLARRRAADRDRQRRRRESLKSTASRDNGHVSRDGHAGEKLEKEVLAGVVSETHYRARAGIEPPQKCAKHEKIKNPPNCGACADARREYRRWEAERNQRLASLPKCRLHRGQPADNCAICRSEELSPP